ncbi:MAG: tetratricopeptide repeat protein [Coprobacter sp.]|nr:tetratricopeptide repeat protein [Coprobacter sp.]
MTEKKKPLSCHPLLYLHLLLALAVTLPAAAQQRQTGYVKTRGRLAADGSLIPGERLSGATIILKGGNNTVSGADGTFTLTLPGSTYYLQNVRKQGYQICDPETLSKQYTRSADPLVIVLETPDRQLEDKLAAERKIRRTLERQLAEREDELETQRARNQLTQDEYNAALQQLYAARKNDERLIEEMAARYSRIDYDQLDEYRRQLAWFIQNGELHRADSLINSRGRLEDRAADIIRQRELNDREQTGLDRRQTRLDQSRQYEIMLLEEFGADMYARCEIDPVRQHGDTLALGDDALRYYHRALEIRRQLWGENHPRTAAGYETLATVYERMNQPDKAREYRLRAREIDPDGTPDRTLDRIPDRTPASPAPGTPSAEK